MQTEDKEHQWAVWTRDLSHRRLGKVVALSVSSVEMTLSPSSAIALAAALSEAANEAAA